MGTMTIKPRLSATRIVGTLLRAELDAGRHAQDLHVAQRIMRRLYEELGRVIGRAGLDILSGHALELARPMHPILFAIDTEGEVISLPGHDAPAREAVALQEGVMAMVVHLVELLAALIGDALVARLLRGASPAVVEEQA